MQDDLKLIKDSPFGNTYGSLSLMQGPQGHMVLQMEDCFGCDYYGPLTPDQVAAFLLLCEVKKV